MIFPYILYFSCYITADLYFKNIYLSYFPELSKETIASNKELHGILTATSWFMAIIYLYLTFHRKFIGKTNDINGILLSFMYSKYTTDILLSPNMSIVEHEMSRTVMWVFTTPIMLKMYTDLNHFKLTDINYQYHLMAIIPHVFMVPFRGQPTYLISTCILSIPCGLFIRTLLKNRYYPFTGLYICIWSIFMTINVLDIIGLCSSTYTHALFNLADTMCKFICAIVLSNYNEQEQHRRATMDIQTTHFIKFMLNSIYKYKEENAQLTPTCQKMVEYIKEKFIKSIPEDVQAIKAELLQKMLPMGFDTSYIEKIMKKTTSSPNLTTSENKEHIDICVLFIDIVNYTELAKRYSGDCIFKMLDNIYNKFDVILKKYKRIQKIETIGDAYMVVGDIFKHENSLEEVIIEFIHLGYDMIKEIKEIDVPDGIPLEIRIGIHIGPVAIGILGTENPRLCIVGHTVNMASRLQSTGQPDTLHVSNTFFEQVEKYKIHVSFLRNENIFLKNIGSVISYTITPPLNN
jgi:class 3 adenylate cyclase